MTLNLNCRCSLIVSLVSILIWIFLFGDAEGKGYYGGGGSRGYGGSGGWLAGFIILILVAIGCGGCCGIAACGYFLTTAEEKDTKEKLEDEKEKERQAW